MNRIARTYVHRINAPPSRVFPMLCPVREKEFVPGWDARIIHSASGSAEKGCVFQTANEGGQPTTWIITRHDQQHGEIQFATVTPDSHAGTLDISVAADPENGSAVTFKYTNVALTDQGRQFVNAFTDDLFRAKMTAFEKALNDCLNR